MLKILGSLIIIGAATIIGFSYSGIYLERVKQLRNIQFALNMLETEIAYTTSPLIEALLSTGEKSSSPISKLFIKMSEILGEKKKDSVYDAFMEAYRHLKEELYFDKEELGVVSSFMQSLGTSDIEGQKKNFNITIKKLESFEKKAEELRTRNEKLYRYLGVSFGVLIVIMLI